MARIVTKHGQKANITRADLLEGEIAVAFNADKTEADLFVGNGESKIPLSLKGEKGDKGDTGEQDIQTVTAAISTADIDGGTF